MKKNKLSFEPKIVCFNCISCNKKYKLLSAHKEDVLNIDICSNCHPFYLGQTNLSRTRGPAEKLKDKFDSGKNFVNKKIK